MLMRDHKPKSFLVSAPVWSPKQGENKQPTLFSREGRLLLWNKTELLFILILA